MAHHGTRTGAVGEDEVRNPDMAIQAAAVEGLTGLRGEFELRDRAVGGQRRVGARGQEKHKRQKPSHAALRADLRAAIAPGASSRSTPNIAHTNRPKKPPGADVGRRSQRMTN